VSTISPPFSTFENGFSVPVEIVIADEGKEIYMTQTSPGGVVIGRFKLQ
jgi:hypothetical protein